MRLLKLTSDESPVRGSPIILNPQDIVAVKLKAERGDPQAPFTVVMTGHGYHVVKETVDEVYRKWSACVMAGADDPLLMAAEE